MVGHSWPEVCLVSLSWPGGDSQSHRSPQRINLQTFARTTLRTTGDDAMHSVIPRCTETDRPLGIRLAWIKRCGGRHAGVSFSGDRRLVSKTLARAISDSTSQVSVVANLGAAAVQA